MIDLGAITDVDHIEQITDHVLYIVSRGPIGNQYGLMRRFDFTNSAAPVLDWSKAMDCPTTADCGTSRSNAVLSSNGSILYTITLMSTNAADNRAGIAL